MIDTIGGVCIFNQFWDARLWGLLIINPDQTYQLTRMKTAMKRNEINPNNFYYFVCVKTGDTKSEDAPNKEAGEEKAEEDNDYHRSDEQVQI